MRKIKQIKKSIGFRTTVIAIAGSVVLFLGGSVQAALVTISTSLNPLQAGTDNQGWWSNTTNNNNPTNDNYVVGNSNDNYRAFFSFDLSGISGTVTSAYFDVRRYDQLGTVNLSLWDLTASASQLITTRQNISNSTIFADLGSGTQYGLYTIANGSSTDVLHLSLNSAAINDLNSTIGQGYFSLGAAILTGGTIFSASGFEPGNTHGSENSIQNLVLEIQPTTTVPEPTTLALMGLGFAGMSQIRRRKHQA